MAATSPAKFSCSPLPVIAEILQEDAIMQRADLQLQVSALVDEIKTKLTYNTDLTPSRSMTGCYAAQLNSGNGIYG
jgi:hypothetical protein